MEFNRWPASIEYFSTQDIRRYPDHKSTSTILTILILQLKFQDFSRYLGMKDTNCNIRSSRENVREYSFRLKKDVPTFRTRL